MTPGQHQSFVDGKWNNLWKYRLVFILPFLVPRVPIPVPVYDIIGSTADRNVVVLNNIHIDIMDYIQPATCTDGEFRKMWAEFEWENKVCECVWVYMSHLHPSHRSR